ncbi:DUF1684 domain-containing protein [Urechidicola sp. KH5]
MKKYFATICFSLLLLACTEKKLQTYADKIEQYQYEMNVEYADKKTSPLTEEAQKTFKGLPFYPTNELLRVTAKLTLTPDSEMFEMNSSTERRPLYRQFATASFDYENVTYTLSLYQSQDVLSDPEYRGYLFLPFTDATNGVSSYGGGRYIELWESDITEGQLVIDFNKAFNPLCAYNPKYSCPVPPKENNLPFEVKAGLMFSH